MSSLSSSPSPTIPTTNATVVRQHRGVRMPNELLRELAQCVPMGWFVGGSSQAKQHRHSIGQLGTALGTYLSQIHGKFAKVVAKQIREIPSVPKMKRSSSSTSSAESEEEKKMRESIAQLSAEQKDEFLRNALTEELSVEQRVELQNKIQNMQQNMQIKAVVDARAAKKRQFTVTAVRALLDKRGKMTENAEKQQREDEKSGGGAGTAEKSATDEPSTSTGYPTSRVDVDPDTLATSSSRQPRDQHQDEGEQTKE